MKKNLLRLAVMGALIPLLASCGSNTVDNSTLVVGMECNYQPFNWTTYKESDYTLPIYGTSGEYADGYDVSICKYLSEATGKDVVIKRIVWDNLIPSLNSGDINLVLAGMTDTATRREAIDFTDPYLSSDLAFLVKTSDMPADGRGSESDPMSYSELLEFFDGKILVCQSGVVGDDFIEDYFVNNESGAKITHASPRDTYPLAAQEVKAGAAFAMPAEKPVIEAMTNLGDLSVLYSDYSFLSEEDQNGLTVSVGIKKGNSELKDEINSALAKLNDEKRGEMMGAAAERSAANA